MDVQIARDSVTVKARVSVEEILVESSFARTQRVIATLAELWPAHGSYLLAHCTVSADGAPLNGRVVRITPPEKPTVGQFVIYEIEYEIPADARPPRRLALRENLLNEIDYAPGNVWEATFVTRIEQEGRPAQEALLLAAQAADRFRLRLESLPRNREGGHRSLAPHRGLRSSTA